MAALMNIAIMTAKVAIKAASAAKLSGGYSPPVSIESAENSLKTLRIFLVAFTWMVGVGLVLEYKTQLLFICRGLLKVVSLKSNSFDRCQLRRLVWHSLGALLVTVGVLGEFWIEFRQYGAENNLSRASASARDTLNAQTAEANERAASNEKEAAELRAKFAWRVVSREQKEKLCQELCEELKHIGGISVTVAYLQPNPEINNFAGLVTDALGYSGVKELGVSPRQAMYVDPGLSITFPRQMIEPPAAKFERVANILKKALENSGIADGPVPLIQPLADDAERKEVIILVGPKPEKSGNKP
jgi:hypothetical protein